MIFSPYDDTQAELFSYVKKTERDWNTYFGEEKLQMKIEASLDIGVPGNPVRLWGGFATGILVSWNCSEPIIPVDATVNVCTSSFYQICKDYNFEEFVSKTLKGLFRIREFGYHNNFDNGNHFIAYGINDKGNNFLVFHSSVNEYKYGKKGLYPHETSWFFKDIKMFSRKNRIYRYISGNTVEKFLEIYSEILKKSIDKHDLFAENFAEKRIMSSVHQHHYFMPTQQSVAIGTYCVDRDGTFPIFSKESGEILLCQPNKYLNTNNKLIPHGWGKMSSVKLDIIPRENSISIQNIDIPLDVETNLLSIPSIVNRDFGTTDKFSEHLKCIGIELDVVEKIKQRFCFSARGLLDIDQ